MDNNTALISMIFSFVILMDGVNPATFSFLMEPPYYSSLYIGGEYDHTPAGTGTSKSLQSHYFVSKERTLQDPAYQLTSSANQRGVEALLSLKKGHQIGSTRIAVQLDS